jgi:hypothetical protein
VTLGPPSLVVPFATTAPPLAADFTAPAWQDATVVSLERLWNGAPAPLGLSTTTRLLWTATDLWVGFTCGYTELDIDAGADPRVKRRGLWERDVCEMFVRSPREAHPAGYKEFEVAPTAQWCDLAIRQPRADVDPGWQSGMRTAAAVDPAASTWYAVMALPFAAFGETPRAGDRWHANLFRIARQDGARHYLAYAPTGTAAPDFHVPERFVALEFVASAAGP